MEINAIYEGDNLEIMSKFPSKSIDLIYADPPFFSNRKYEVIWKDKAEISSFEDRWEGGIEHYIAWMEPRLRECHRLLKDTGSIYLHCDWHASAHLKVLMDRIFNDSNFRNEIVWPRTYAHSDSKQGAKAFGRIHDTILFYSKSVNNTWNTQYRPYGQDYIEKTFKQMDEEGRRYQTVTLTASKPGGDTEFEWHGIRPPNGRYWAYSKANLDKMSIELFNRLKSVENSLSSNEKLSVMRGRLNDLNGEITKLRSELLSKRWKEIDEAQGLTLLSQVLYLSESIIDRVLNDIDRKKSDSLKEINIMMGISLYLLLKFMAMVKKKVTIESLVYALSSVQVFLDYYEVASFT